MVSWKFKKAWITTTIEDGVEQAALVVDATIESDKDTFDSDNVSDSDDVDIWHKQHVLNYHYYVAYSCLLTITGIYF